MIYIKDFISPIKLDKCRIFRTRSNEWSCNEPIKMIVLYDDVRNVTMQCSVSEFIQSPIVPKVLGVITSDYSSFTLVKYNSIEIRLIKCIKNVTIDTQCTSDMYNSIIIFNRRMYTVFDLLLCMDDFDCDILSGELKVGHKIFYITILVDNYKEFKTLYAKYRTMSGNTSRINLNDWASDLWF